MKRDKSNLPQIEKRTLKIELRAEENAESRTLSGYAAVFNELSEPIWWFREQITPEAFENTDMNDVVALFNHDDNKILARVSADTLKLSVDERGLKFEFDAPNTTLGNDLLEDVRNGNVQHCSFAFTIRKQAWEEYTDAENDNIEELRTIMEIDTLYDVSLVVRPAYKATEVDARNVEHLRDEYEKRKNEKTKLPGVESEYITETELRVNENRLDMILAMEPKTDK